MMRDVAKNEFQGTGREKGRPQACSDKSVSLEDGGMAEERERL